MFGDGASSIRVCLMTSSHPVDYSRFYHREAASLAKAGYVVNLVGLKPTSSVSPSGGISLFATEERRGLAKLRTLAEIYRVALRLKASVYHCFDPWTLAVALVLARRSPHIKVIYDSTELYPSYYAERKDIPLILRRFLACFVRQLEQVAVRRIDGVIETNLTRAQRFRKYGREVTLVPNFPLTQSLSTFVAQREPVIAYTGLVSRERGFDKLLVAFARLAHGFPDLRLRIVGDFDPRGNLAQWSAAFIKKHNLNTKVELLGWLPYEQMLRAISKCLVGVILLQPGRTNDYTGQPNKLFEFMACGLAVVASNFPEIAPVIGEAGCGWLVDPTNISSITQALRTALANPECCQAKGFAGREAVLNRYNWSQAEANLLNLYQKLAR